MVTQGIAQVVIVREAELSRSKPSYGDVPDVLKDVIEDVRPDATVVIMDTADAAIQGTDEAATIVFISNFVFDTAAQIKKEHSSRRVLLITGDPSRVSTEAGVEVISRRLMTSDRESFVKNVLGL